MNKGSENLLPGSTNEDEYQGGGYGKQGLPIPSEKSILPCKNCGGGKNQPHKDGCISAG